MSRSTTNLLGILITIAAGTYFFLMYCSECRSPHREGAVMDTSARSEVPAGTSYPFAVNAVDFNVEVDGNFDFRESEASFMTPVDARVDAAIGRLRQYLGENGDKLLLITGFFNVGESNQTAFPNLGIARAHDVKDYMISQGIASSQLRMEGRLHNEMVPENSVYRGPVAYGMETASEEERERIHALYDRLKDDPLVLYFNSAEASIDLDDVQRKKFLDLMTYMDLEPEARCLVTGHTDDSGLRSTNMALGLERANFARDYLVGNGIDRNRIHADSKGPDEPLAPNDSEDGQALNRRTVITLQ